MHIYIALGITPQYIYIDWLHIICSYWYYNDMLLNVTIYSADLHSVDLDLQISKGEDNLKYGQINGCN